MLSKHTGAEALEHSQANPDAGTLRTFSASLSQVHDEDALAHLVSQMALKTLAIHRERAMRNACLLALAGRATFSPRPVVRRLPFLSTASRPIAARQRTAEKSADL